MSKPELIKSSGWMFIAGAVAFITILTSSDSIAFPGSVISSILLAVGMLRLRARYGERAGSFGRNILLMSVIGMVLLYLIVAYFILMSVGVLPAIQVPESSWILIFGGPAITLLGLTLFGLTALISRPMPRLNWLPVFAGIWYPAFYFFAADYLFTHHGKYQYDIAIRMIAIIGLIQFLALWALGFVWNDDSSKELATA